MRAAAAKYSRTQTKLKTGTDLRAERDIAASPQSRIDYLEVRLEFAAVAEAVNGDFACP